MEIRRRRQAQYNMENKGKHKAGKETTNVIIKVKNNLKHIRKEETPKRRSRKRKRQHETTNNKKGNTQNKNNAAHETTQTRNKKTNTNI